MTATTINPDWADAYSSGSVGGLLGAVLAPVGGFGKFCLVLLALSIVANNIPNNYSVSTRISDGRLTWLARIIRSSSRKLGSQGPSILVDSCGCHRLRHCRCRWKRSFRYHPSVLPSVHGILVYAVLRRSFYGTSRFPTTGLRFGTLGQSKGSSARNCSVAVLRCWCCHGRHGDEARTLR